MKLSPFSHEVSPPPLLSFPNVNWMQEENVDHHGTWAVSCIF